MRMDGEARLAHGKLVISRDWPCLAALCCVFHGITLDRRRRGR
jgi:hypothetical protein